MKPRGWVISVIMLLLSLSVFQARSQTNLTGIAVHPSSVQQGESVTVVAVVINNGSSGTFDFELDLHFANGDYLNVLDKDCGNFIASGSQTTITFVSSPLNYSQGFYNLKVTGGLSSCWDCGIAPSSCIDLIDYNSFEITNPEPECPAPSNVDINTNYTSAELNWPNVSEADQYVLCWEGGGDYYCDETTLSQYTIEDLIPGITYTFELISECNGDASIPWYEGSFTTDDCRVNPDIDPEQQEVCIGEDAEFDVAANGGGTGPYNYQWYKDGNRLNGETDDVIQINNVQLEDAGEYRCHVENSCGDQDDVYGTLTVATCNPNVDFIADPSRIKQNESTDFEDMSSNNPNSWNWDFEGGDPSSSSQRDPQNIEYNTPGCWDVSLTATNNSGPSTETKYCYISVYPDYSDPVPEDYAQIYGYPSAYSGDPINMATGAYTVIYKDIILPDRKMNLDWFRTYNSRRDTDGPMGYNWSHNWDIKATIQPEELITVQNWDGHLSRFVYVEEDLYMPLYGGTYAKMVPNGSNYDLIYEDGRVNRFNANGNIISQTDRYGNQTHFTYSSNRLTRVTGPGGRFISVTYNGQNKVSTITDNGSRTVSFTYNSSGDLTNVVNARGGITQIAYDGQHQILTITDPRGNTYVDNTYDNQNRVVQQRDALGSSCFVAYDSPVAGATTFTDNNGGIKTYYHDASFRLTRMVDELGFDVEYEYDIHHNKTRVLDERNKETTMLYDTLGNRTSITNANGATTTLSYTDFHRPTQINDYEGQITSIVYDNKGNPTQTTLPNGGQINNSYTSTGLLQSVTDAEGNTTSFTYNQYGDLTQISTPSGNTTIVYDNVGRRISATDANGNTSQFTYDAYNNLVNMTDPLGNSLVYTYDANGNLVSMTDKRGNTTSIIYDPRDRQTSVNMPLGVSITYVYDNLDNLIQLKDGEGNEFNYTYDARSQLVNSSNALGSFQYVYDPAGNLLTFTNPLGHAINSNYDDLNRRISVTDALGNTTSYTYDEVNRLVETTNASGNQNFYSYNGIGKLLSVTDPLGHLAAYEYDLNGNLVSLTDPNTNQYTFTYDASNRLQSKMIPGGYQYSYGYDGVGNTTSTTDANGTTATMIYDGLNRVTGINYSTGEAYTYGYDANNNVTSATNQWGSYTVQYDDLNRMSQVTDPFGDRISYGYDKAGNRTSITYPSSGPDKVVFYEYNGINRMTSVTDWLNNTTSYQYDAAGRLISSILPNGMRAEMGYDAAGRLISKYNYNPDNSVLSFQEFTLDALGNIIEEQSDFPATIGDLENLDITYAYGSDDRIISAGDISFQHDNNGNRTSMSGPSFSRTYSYGGDNLLESIVQDTLLLEFTYDPFKIRNEKRVNGNVQRFTLDINDQLTQFIQEKDAFGNTKVDYIYGQGLIGSIGDDGEEVYYTFDHRGNTLATTQNDAGLLDSYLYSPFGRIVSNDPVSSQPFTFLGQYGVQRDHLDEYYIRARYYDADIGRFSSKDVWPIDLRKTQTINSYTYSLNNPINRIDRSGYNSIWNNGYQSNSLFTSNNYTLFSYQINSIPGDQTNVSYLGLPGYEFETPVLNEWIGVLSQFYSEYLYFEIEIEQYTPGTPVEVDPAVYGVIVTCLGGGIFVSAYQTGSALGSGNPDEALVIIGEEIATSAIDYALQSTPIVGCVWGVLTYIYGDPIVNLLND